MKKIFKKFITLVVIISVNQIYSQNFKAGEIIKLTAPVKVESVPIALHTKNVDLSVKTEYLDTYKYRVMEINDSTVKLLALNFKESKKEKDSAKSNLSELYNNKIYVISRTDFDAFAIKYEPKERLSVGLLTLPFKARPQDDISFDTEFNLSSTLNVRFFDIAGSSFNYQVGAGIGSVGLNTSNSLGLSDDEAQDVATLTLLNGIMIQYNKVQVGLYSGVDFINNQKNYQWESNGNLWLGFGIGYNLFDISISNEKIKQ